MSVVLIRRARAGKGLCIHEAASVLEMQRLGTVFIGLLALESFPARASDGLGVPPAKTLRHPPGGTLRETPSGRHSPAKAQAPRRAKANGHFSRPRAPKLSPGREAFPFRAPPGEGL